MVVFRSTTDVVCVMGKGAAFFLSFAASEMTTGGWGNRFVHATVALIFKYGCISSLEVLFYSLKGSQGFVQNTTALKKIFFKRSSLFEKCIVQQVEDIKIKLWIKDDVKKKKKKNPC